MFLYHGNLLGCILTKIDLLSEGEDTKVTSCIVSLVCLLYNSSPFHLPISPRLYAETHSLHSSNPCVATVSAAHHVSIAICFSRKEKAAEKHPWMRAMKTSASQ